MRPYLAIIRDSFHAAFASRILWIVLIAIFVLLLALSPVGYQEVYTVDFSRGDINSNSRLTGLLGKALESDQDTPAKRIAETLPLELQEKVKTALNEEDKRPRTGEYIDAFNEVIASENWYDDELWKGAQRLRELRELDELDTDSIDDRLRMRRARLRVEAALPGAFRSRPDRSIQLTYGFLETPLKLPLRKDQFADILNQVVYPTILNFLLGVGAVFVGILVTSPIIPDMFQPGALHLLLSKPVSRPALYLSKFVGGCAFVLLCVSLLVAGLWLISGVRLDIWNHRLFYSIPVFVFLFAVYYSVSALAGLHWRSAVVSVAVTVVFWFLCFVVGTASNLFEGLVADPARVRHMTVAGDEILLSTQAGGLYRVSTSGGEKTALIDSLFGAPPIPIEPVKMPDGRIAIIRNEGGGFGQFGGAAKLAIFDPNDSWKELPGLELPRGTSRLIPTPGGGLLSVSLNGVSYAPKDKLLINPETEDEPKRSGLFGGFQKMLGAVTSGFQPALPNDFSLISPSAVELTPESGNLVVYSGGNLYTFARQNGAAKWEVAEMIEIEGDNSTQVRMAVTSKHVLLARKGDPFRIFDPNSLELLAELPSDDTYSVDRLAVAPNGQYAMALLSNKSLLKVDLKNEPKLVPPNLPNQGDIESIAWKDDSLWISHNIDRVKKIDVSTGSVTAECIPARDVWRNAYAWVITPLRSITPQTGEVGEIVIAAICGRSNIELTVGDNVEKQQLSIIRPLATCGGFAAVMLLLGCFYVYRQDF